MSHFAFGSWTLRSIAGVVLVTVGVVGSHSSGVEAIRYGDRAAESSDCGGDHEDREHGDRGHEDRGQDDRSHDHRGRGRGRGRGQDNRDQDNPPATGPGLQQIISVRVPSTAFLRIDKSGRVTAAATNTGCQPSKGDDVFVLRPDGTIEPATTINIDDCEWRGDFSVPGRFQPQDCSADHRRKAAESRTL